MRVVPDAGDSRSGRRLLGDFGANVSKKVQLREILPGCRECVLTVSVTPGDPGRVLFVAMKSTLSAILAAISTLSASAAEVREFRNNKGQVIKAEPVVVQGTNLTLKLENGKPATIPIKSLSREDQDFILRWMVHDPKALSYSFDCKSEEKGGAVEKKESRLGKLETEERFYTVKINNRCQNPLDNLKVSYRIFLEDRVEDNGLPRDQAGVTWKGGLLDLGRLTYNQSTTITTEPHKVQQATPNSLAGFAGVDVKTKKDRMRGVWIKFYRHGVEVGEWKSQGLVKCDWPESPGEKTTLETDAAENKKKAEAAAAPPAATPAETAPVVPKKLNTDELPQELKFFELEDTEKK